MNKRDLYLKTANLIEREPRLFDFSVSHIPPCGSPGCVLGLMGTVIGIKEGGSLRNVTEIIKVSERDFYNRMSKALGDNNWIYFPDLAVKALRNLADQEQPERNWAQEQYQKAINGPKLVEVAA